jgi:hypothetical protein
MSMEHWWNGTDRGETRMGYWWNGTDRRETRMGHWWTGTDRGKLTYGRKICPSANFAPQIPNGLT